MDRLSLTGDVERLGVVPRAVREALEGQPSVAVHIHRFPYAARTAVGRIEVLDASLEPEYGGHQVKHVEKDTDWWAILDGLGLLPMTPEWRAMLTSGKAAWIVPADTDGLIHEWDSIQGEPPTDVEHYRWDTPGQGGQPPQSLTMEQTNHPRIR